jgi:predicted nuclease of restriction endonuclease-like (RecB) superfamily
MSENEIALVGYGDLLARIKERIRYAQMQTLIKVNQELVLLYWEVGHDILQRQEEQGWGAKVIDQLSRDLRKEFPQTQGFSPRNLKYMRAFADAWKKEQIVQAPLAQLTWYHHLTLIEKVKDEEMRLWYARATFEHGWSRNVLAMQIESRLHERQGQAVSNFDRTLPPPQSDLAQALTKDPYNFDFLSLSEEVHERVIERGLLEQIRKFLLEMGTGFAFVGSQYPLEVDGQDYYLDLLFYHLQLRCFVIVDLKAVEFQPEFVGKMNFYLAAVDDTLRHETDAPSIGLLLCRKKKALSVEYALRNVGTPIAVAEFVTELARRIEAELTLLEIADDAGDEN